MYATSLTFEDALRLQARDAKAEGEKEERIKNLSFMLQNGIDEETLRASSLYSEKEIQEAILKASEK